MASVNRALQTCRYQWLSLANILGFILKTELHLVKDSVEQFS